eukprot:2416398-Prymnesium_polylepis.1
MATGSCLRTSWELPAGAERASNDHVRPRRRPWMFSTGSGSCASDTGGMLGGGGGGNAPLVPAVDGTSTRMVSPASAVMGTSTRTATPSCVT